MDQSGLINALNEDLTLEFQSIVQYVQHIASLKGAAYQSTLDELTLHTTQELEHALTLARQIDFLGGVPATTIPDVEHFADTRAALESDLALEEHQLDRYRERVKQAADIGLPDVAEALAPLLEQTQEHARDLRAALG
jgi:bacterioferritin